MNLIPHITYSHILVNYIPWCSQSLQKVRGGKTPADQFCDSYFPTHFYKYVLLPHAPLVKRNLCFENKTMKSISTDVLLQKLALLICSPQVKVFISTQCWYHDREVLYFSSLPSHKFGLFLKEGCTLHCTSPWILQQ
jgi:hypothetical protein